jgi:tetratricopeptide (TPR) repeat protein
MSTTAHVPTATHAADRGPPECLSHDDEVRLVRLLDRTLGAGFKLVMWETPTPRDRAAAAAWMDSLLAARSAKAIPVDLVALLGRTEDSAPRSVNVWQALKQFKPPETVTDRRTVLMLSGFEELMYHGDAGRSALLQQFNVQRDILVRDYPCWWLLLIHPASRQKWKAVAPDFCDFVALWIESPLPSVERDVRPHEMPSRDAERPFSFGSESDSWPPELAAALAALNASRLDSALDHLQSFHAATSSAARNEWTLAIADLLQGEILRLRGDSQTALRLWRDRALPTFARLGKLPDQAIALLCIADVLVNLGNLREARRLFVEAQRIRERLAQAEPDRADYQRDLSVSYNKMGDLYSALGQGDAARDAYQKSLQLRERLAQAEPDRADYQVDLALSLARIGSGDPAGQTHLQRALGILLALDRAGRLAPADRPKIAALEAMIEAGASQ